MQDSWKQLKSDNTSWQNILTSSYNLQSQWHVVCTLYHEMKNQLTRKVGFEGTPKMDPCWKSQPVTYNVKYGVEIRIESVNKDNSHSWVRISHVLNKFVTDLIDKEYDDNEQETSTTKTEVFAFASRSKAKAQPRRPSTTCSSSKTIPFLERTWIDIEPGAQFDQAYPEAKNKHSSSTRRGDRILGTETWSSQQNLSTLNIGLMMYGRAKWQEAEATIKDFNTVQKILYLRSLQCHSGRNPIDPSLQDNVLIAINIFEYISHVGCAVNLHSITNSGLIPGGQNSSRERQTVFFTAVNPMHKNHQDPIELDLTKPRLAAYKKKWKVHQDTVYWVDIQLAQRKGLKFYQTRSNAVILYDTLSADCISKAIVIKSEEILYQKVYVSRPPPTIPFQDNWTCDSDSDVARSSKDIQRIELKPNTQLSSTGWLVTKWSEETLERTRFDRDTLNWEKHDNVTDPTSTGKPVCGHESTERCVLTPKHVENDQTGTVETRHGGSKRGTQNWFQSTRIVTLSCKGSRTSPSSRACIKDRKSSSSSSTSSRLAAE